MKKRTVMSISSVLILVFGSIWWWNDGMTYMYRVVNKGYREQLLDVCIFHPLTSYRLKCKHTNEAGLISTEKMVGSKALRFEA